MNSAAQLSAAQQLASGGGGAGLPSLESSGAGGEDDIPELEAVEEEGPVDETGVDPKDIELVIQQVGCSRAKAVKVLKESGGDLINASVYPIVLPYASTNLFPSSHGCKRVILLYLFVYFYPLPCTSCRPSKFSARYTSLTVCHTLARTMQQSGQHQLFCHRLSST